MKHVSSPTSCPPEANSESLTVGSSLLQIAIVAGCLTLVACGGGSSSSDSDTMPAMMTATDADADEDMESDTPEGMVADEMPDTTPMTGGEPTGDGGSQLQGLGTGNVILLGNIDIDADGDSANAIFVRTNLAVPVESAAQQVLFNTDMCEVIDFDTTLDPDFPLDLEGIIFDPVSAGEIITLTSPAGTFTEFERMQEQLNTELFSLYQVPGDGSLPGPLPANTVIDIPGDEFPAFTNVATPIVPPLTAFTSSTGQSVTAGSTFTWNGNPSGDSFINLSATVIPIFDPTTFTDPNLDLTDISFSVRTLSCSLVDDGSFSLPASIQAELGADFNADLAVSRTGLRFERNGDALLTVTVSSSL